MIPNPNNNWKKIANYYKVIYSVLKYAIILYVKPKWGDGDMADSVVINFLSPEVER